MEKRITGHTELLGLIATPRGIQSSNITFFHQPKALYLCFNHLLLLFTVFICITTSSFICQRFFISINIPNKRYRLL